MRILRTIVALLVALSVAVLPLVGSAAAGLSPAEARVAQGTATTAMASGSAMSMNAMSMNHDCADMVKTGLNKLRHSKQCDQRGHCPMMAFCAAMSVGIAGPAFFNVDYPILSSNRLPFAADNALAAQGGSPPFKPPRV